MGAIQFGFVFRRSGHAWALALLLSLCGLPIRLGAEVKGLMLGDDGRCAARDFRQVRLTQGEQVVALDNIPPEADLTTLQAWAPRVGLQLLDWQRAEDGKTVRCRVRSKHAAPKVGVDFVYILTGLTWSAEYEVWIRSEMDKGGGAVSADLRGGVRFENETNMAFSNVNVRLVGSAVQPGSNPEWPGFLLLDRQTPLSDLWFPPKERTGPAYVYTLADRVTIPARSIIVAPIVNQTRVPAVRRYTFSSDEIPLGARELAPLREWIAFSYSRGRESRVALPPGRVRVAVGPRRERVFDARFKRTVPGSEIRVDLGPGAAVKGRRSRVASTAGAGFREETYELSVRNDDVTDAIVEFEEQPPASLGWTVVRASTSYQERANRLLFRVTVPAGGEESIQYSIKVREPYL